MTSIAVSWRADMVEKGISGENGTSERFQATPSPDAAAERAPVSVFGVEGDESTIGAVLIIGVLAFLSDYMARTYYCTC